MHMCVCVCECNESVGLCKCLGLLKDGTSGTGGIYTFGDYVYETTMDSYRYWGYLLVL